MMFPHHLILFPECHDAGISAASCSLAASHTSLPAMILARQAGARHRPPAPPAAFSPAGYDGSLPRTRPCRQSLTAEESVGPAAAATERRRHLADGPPGRVSCLGRPGRAGPAHSTLPCPRGVAWEVAGRRETSDEGPARCVHRVVVPGGGPRHAGRARCRPRRAEQPDREAGRGHCPAQAPPGRGGAAGHAHALLLGRPRKQQQSTVRDASNLACRRLCGAEPAAPARAARTARLPRHCPPA